MSARWTDVVWDVRAQLGLSNDELARDADGPDGCPFVAYELTWRSPAGEGEGRAALDPGRDRLGTRFETGRFGGDRMSTTVVSGDATVFGLPGPDHDRGLAIWGPDGVATFDLTEPTADLALTCATLMDAALVEFQQADGDGFATVLSQVFSPDQSPIVLRYEDATFPVSRVRVSFTEDCLPSGMLPPTYLSRLTALAAARPGGGSESIASGSGDEGREDAAGGGADSASRGGLADSGGAWAPPGVDELDRSRAGARRAGTAPRPADAEGGAPADVAATGIGVDDVSVPQRPGSATGGGDHPGEPGAAGGNADRAESGAAEPAPQDDGSIGDDGGPEPDVAGEVDGGEDRQPVDDAPDGLREIHGGDEESMQERSPHDRGENDGGAEPRAVGAETGDAAPTREGDSASGGEDDRDEVGGDTGDEAPTDADEHPGAGDGVGDDPDRTVNGESSIGESAATGTGDEEPPPDRPTDPDREPAGVEVARGEDAGEDPARGGRPIGEGVDVPGFVFVEACWETVEDRAFNSTIVDPAAYIASNQQMVDAMSGSLRPLLRPNSTYAIEVTTADVVSVDQTVQATNFSSHWVGFRTAGPPGHFHEYPDGAGTTKHANWESDRFALERLEPYIDTQRSYPAPDGNLIGAKPMYFENPDVRLYFTQNYVERFFGDWKELGPTLPELSTTLELDLVDPAIDTDPPPPSQPPPSSSAAAVTSPDASPIPATAGVVSFVADDAPLVPTSAAMLGNMMELGPACGGNIDPPTVPASMAEVAPVNLRPLTLYTASWKVRFEGRAREVHSYQFQTSAYGTHEEQVHSYLPDRTADPAGPVIARVFVIELSVPIDATELASVVAGNPPASLRSAYASQYDQIVDGVVGVTELPAAVGTEFTAITHAGHTYALMVRNPEPFNDPRMPFDTLRRTVSAPGLSTIVSPDAARAVLVDPSGATIAEGARQLQFEHMAFTSSGTEVRSVETVSIVVPPVPPAVAEEPK